jgi:hypothetical protein
MDIICGARKDGATYQAITDKLNGLGYTTRYGKSFNPIQVQRLFSKCIKSYLSNDNMIVVLGVIKQKGILIPLFVYRCMYVFMLDMIDVFEKYQHLMFV